MKVLGNPIHTEITPNKSSQKTASNQSQNILPKDDAFLHSIVDVYTTYTKEYPIESKVIGVTKDQLETLLQEKPEHFKSDGNRHWLLIEDIWYELKTISKDPSEESKLKSTSQVLLDMTHECLERGQNRLDKVFHDWVMKKDILYPNMGKNAIITLEDVLEAHEEEKLL
ncbi:MAG: hypothetical protein ACRCTE_10080 [Cellulosilyticaceae bacterium]